jgi:aldehyde dehydrogenase (NAD+)
MKQVDPWIGGRSASDAGWPRLEVSSPCDGTLVSSVALCDGLALDTAVAAAKQAAPAWAALPVSARGRVLRAIGDSIRRHAEELIDLECAETGKLRAEMSAFLTVSADYYDYYGGVIGAFFGDTINLGANQHAFTTREPYGVVGMITPWNGPLSQATRGIAAALAVGNAVVLKPSEFTPSTSVRLAEISEAAGLPPGLLNVVTGTGSEIGAALVSHPDVAMIAFTGSVATGIAVARAAADALKPTMLELGGKSPNIVFPDADLDKAAASAATICTSTGQQCAALSRLIVHESIQETLIRKVVALLETRRPGPTLAPITTPDQYEKVLSYFKVAEADGARLVTGGRAATEGELERGRYVHPTLYADVRPDMRIFREEIFGPVIGVTPFRDEEEAVALANDSDYGLVASLWTRDLSRALRVAGQLQAGQVIVNGGRTGVDTPFGGYKASGWGREKGFEALHGYSRSKTTVIGLDR